MTTPTPADLRALLAGVLADLDGCPFNEDVNDASMCRCGLPALNHDTVVEQIVLGSHPHIADLLDRVEAAERLRGGVEALAAKWINDDDYSQWGSHEKGSCGRQIRALLAEVTP